MLKIMFANSPLLRARCQNLFQKCCLRQSVEERLGLPEKPKRPSSAFVLYLNQIRPEIIAKNPQSSPKDIMKIGAEWWKKCNEPAKKQFQDQYIKDKSLYDSLIAKYNASLTADQKNEIEGAKDAIKEQKEKREIRLASIKRNKELGKPLKPLSSYFLFAKSEQGNRGNIDIREYQTILSKKWKSLPEHVKQKFTDEAAAAKEAYEKKLYAWEKKMIKQGHLDVVRDKSLEDQSD